MGKKIGRVGPFVTGSNTITTTLSGTPTIATFVVGGKSSGDTDNHGSFGTYDGSIQNVQFWSPVSSGTNNTDVILIKDGTGTVIFQAQATGLSSSGGVGTVTINVSVNQTNFRTTLIVEN